MGWVWAVLLLLCSITMVRCYTYTTAKRRRYTPARTLAVLGSGGHTMEMIALLRNLDRSKYWPRCYVLAKTDNHSLEKLQATIGISEDEVIYRIPRSREVGQSYLSSVFTTLWSIFSSFTAVVFFRPNLILCNGPGTCIPVCVVASLLRILGVLQTKIVYVESVCRVHTLSLSGLILYHLRIADQVLVQWQQLTLHFPRTKYTGLIY
eukprot:Rmarinus@m.27633